MKTIIRYQNTKGRRGTNGGRSQRGRRANNSVGGTRRRSCPAIESRKTELGKRREKIRGQKGAGKLTIGGMSKKQINYQGRKKS